MFARILLLAVAAISVAISGAEVAYAKISVPQLERQAQTYRERLVSSSARGQSDIVATLAQAKAATQAGRHKEALRLLESAAGRNPDNYPLWTRIAQAWGELAPLAPDAQSASYAAYLLASRPEEEVEALLLLANLAAQSITRLKDAQFSAEEKVTKLRSAIDLATGNLPTEPSEKDGGTDSNSKTDTTIAAIQTRCAQPPARQETKDVPAPLKELYRQMDEALRLECQTNGRMADAVKTAATMYQEAFRVLNISRDVHAFISERFSEMMKVLDLKTKGFSFKLSDTATAACVNFTMPLKADVRLYKSRFIQVFLIEYGKAQPGGGSAAPTRSPLAVDLTIQREELCLHGLAHGKTYDVAFKSGLPSANDLELNQDVVLEAVVPDRTPTIAFQGSAFLVPSQGERVIPMTTVNVSKVGLSLYRISDRTLHRQIVMKQLGGEMDADKLDDLTGDFAEEIWTGEKQIESRSNQSVITHLPIFELLQTRRAWINSNESTASATAKGHFSSGSFSGGQAAFQAPEAKPWEPGVFALVASLPDGSKERTSPVQWFVFTDIGLTYYRSTSKLYVVARSLSTGKALGNAHIELVAANNRVLERHGTDSNGVAVFDARLAAGERGNRLAAILAHAEDDFAFLDFTHDIFDLSNYGVAGREPPKGDDAYIYTDRGVYRPVAGETVNVTVLVRDAKAALPKLSVPLNLRIVSSKTGAVIASAKEPISPREVLDNGGAIGRKLELSKTAPLGAADVEVRLGDAPDPIGRATIQIAQFRPDRARLSFSTPGRWTKKLGANNSLQLAGKFEAQYLYGRRSSSEGPQDAPATGLSGEMVVAVEKTKTPFGRCYDDFVFQDEAEAFVAYQDRQPLPPTMSDGSLSFDNTFQRVPLASSPLQARVTVNLFDQGGIVASKTESVPLDREGPYLGLRRQSLPVDNIRTGVSFDVLALTSDKRLLPGAEISYRLFRERSELIWFKIEYGDWRYRQGISRNLVKEDRVFSQDAPDDCKTANARLPRFDLEVGAYRLEVTGPSGSTNSVAFEVGTPSGIKRPDPQTMALRMSKPSYGPGEEAEIFVEAPFDGRVMVAIAGDDEIEQWLSGETVDGKATLKTRLPGVYAGRGFYAIGTVFRRNTDGSEARGPARALGTAYFNVAQESHFLKVSLEGTPYRITPSSRLSARIEVQDWAGQKLNGRAHVALYAVDEGVVNITSHALADPVDHFYGQRRLNFRLYDSYGRILLTRSGGDRYLSRLYLNNFLSERLVSSFEPPQPVEFRDGVGMISFPEPFENFNGTLRLSAMVWTDTLMGAGTKDVLVRDSIVAEMGLPRFITPGDKVQVPLALTNLEAADGAYRIAISSPFVTGISIPSENLTFHATDDVSLQLNQNQRKLIYLTVNPAPNADQTAHNKIDIHVTGADQENAVSIRWSWNTLIRPARVQTVERVAAQAIPPNGELALDRALLPQGSDTANALVQVQITDDDLPVPVSSAGNLLSGSQTLDRLVWSGILMSQNASGAPPPSELASVMGDIIALQDKNGSFALFRKTPIALDDAISSGEASSSGEDQSSPQAGSALWRTALALDFLRLNEGVGGRSSGYYAAVKRGSSFLQQEITRILDESSNGEGEEGLPAPSSTAEKRAKPADDEQPAETVAPEQRTPPAHPAAEATPPEGEDAEAPDECDNGFAYGTLVLTSLKMSNAQFLERAAQFCAGQTQALTAVILAAAYREFGKTDLVVPTLANFRKGFTSGDEKASREKDEAHSAMILAFLSKAEPNAKELSELGKIFSAAPQGKKLPMSLEVQAWLTRTAAARRTNDNTAPLKVDASGAEAKDVFETRRPHLVATRFLSSADLRAGNMKLRNSSSVPVTATVFLRGLSKSSLPEVPDFSIKRRFLDANGKEIGPGTPINQNSIIFVVIEGKIASAEIDQKLLIVDQLSSGFEVLSDNAYGDIRQKGEALSIDLPKAQGEVERSEVRDDRFIAIMRPHQHDFRLAYPVRVTMSGELKLRPVWVEYLDAPQFTVSSPEEPSSLKVVAR
jgi:uncharacterized protein YfaS (alpha-2-macroglobulin family)